MEGGETDVERTSNGCHEEYPLPEVIIRSNNRCRFPITIEPVVFVIFLCETIKVKTCMVHFHFNKSICNELLHPDRNVTDAEEMIQQYSAVILTAMNFLAKFFPAVMSLFLGPWSDYNGRKFMLVSPALGYCVQYMLLVVLTFLPKLGPEYTLLVVIPVALTGGLINFITSAYSYISDICSEENRSFRITLLEAVIYASVYTGMLSSSYLLKAGRTYGYTFIYGSNALILFLVTVPTYFFVRESVQITETSRQFFNIFDFRLLKEVFQVCFKKREGSGRTIIFLVIASLTITLGVGSGESSLNYLYTKLKFGWDVYDFTLWASTLLLSSFIGLLIGSAIFTKWLKVPDAVLEIISFSSNAASLLYIGLIPANAPHLMFYAGFIVIFNGLSGPIGRAILSKSVPKEDLGKVYALLAAAEAIFPLASGPLFTALYNTTLKTVPNAFLFVSCGMFFLCAVFFVIIYFLQKRNAQVRFERLDNKTEND